MSCNYAEGLSPYSNKGVLGAPERFDTAEIIEEKCNKLAGWIRSASHVVLHTGAGISTTAGIPDFRGPNGVWTLEKKGLKPNVDISFSDAVPTKTHMAIKKLIDMNYVQYIISQNIDGLHLKSGIERKHMAELHGNMFIEECNYCSSQFVRSIPTSTVGKKSLGTDCRRFVRGRACRGKLHDTILDWEHSLPDKDLEMSDYHSSVADLNICLGTTLQIVPSGNLPLKCKKFGGKVVIINLQPTKHDKKSDLIINTFVDDVMEKVIKKLGLEIPDYCRGTDPTKNNIAGTFEWNISKSMIKDVKAIYESRKNELKELKKRPAEMNNENKNKPAKFHKKEEHKMQEIKKRPSELENENKLVEFSENKEDIKEENKNAIVIISDSEDDVNVIDLT